MLSRANTLLRNWLSCSLKVFGRMGVIHTMNKITKRILTVWAGVVVTALAIVVFSIAHAQGGPMMSGGRAGAPERTPMMVVPVVLGKVTAVNGATITITGSRPMGATTTYMIDATNAVVIKNAATSSVSAIAVGDMIVVQGKVVGTSVTATRVIDGLGRPTHGDLLGERPTGTRMMDATGSREGFGDGMRPTGTPPFATGTFRGDDYGPRYFSTSTASGTPWQGPTSTHGGFMSSMSDFFGNFLGHLKFW